MPRFAILEHDWPTPHFDLLLERDGVLKAWRLPSHFDPNEPTEATANFDHRLNYLDYEGPLSGDRGTVTRWDGGELEWVNESADQCVVQFTGTKLIGRFELRRREHRWVFRRS